MNRFIPILQRSALFRGLTPDELEQLLRRQPPVCRTYQKKEYLLHAGEPIDRFGLVVEGNVTVMKEDFWGNRNILAKIQPGELFAETYAIAAHQVLGVSVMTDEGATVLFFHMGQFLAPTAEPDKLSGQMLRNLLQVITQKNLQLNAKLTHLTQRTTREKLLSYLSEESLCQGRSEFDIPFNRQQLADYLSVNRSAMSQELCQLRDEGRIRFRRNHFALLRPPVTRPGRP